MSLHGARLIGGEKEPLGDRAQVRYIADRLIHGAAVNSEDELLFMSVGISLRGLREWLIARTRDTKSPLPLVRPASPSNPAPEETGSERIGRVEEWARMTSLEIDGVRIEIVVSRNLSSFSQFRSIYETTASLKLQSQVPLSLTSWRRRWIEPLRDLVLFGTREQTVLLALNGHVGAERGYQPVSVFTAADVALHPPQHIEYHQRDLLPAGIWDQEGLADLLGSWTTLHRDLGAVAQAFFELLNSTDVPPLTRLLRLTSCAEGYHRSLHDEPPLADEQHEAMVIAMIDALPDDPTVRSHYEGRLRHANSQSQRRRIRWLIERAAQVDERLEGQASRLTNRLVGWRNDQTHIDPDTGAPLLDDLLLLNAVLTYVLEANILLDIGLGEDASYCLAHGHVWDDPIPTLLA